MFWKYGLICKIECRTSRLLYTRYIFLTVIREVLTAPTSFLSGCFLQTLEVIVALLDSQNEHLELSKLPFLKYNFYRP